MASDATSQTQLPPAHKAQPLAKPQPPVAQLMAAVVPPLILGVGFFVLYAWIRSGLPEYRQFLMPSAGDMWNKAFSRPSVWAELGYRAGITMSIAVTGLAISIPIGMAMGIVMFRMRLLERAIFPYLVVLQSIPVLAIIPLIQSALGFGFLPKVLVVTIFTFFSVPTTLLLGLKSLDRGVIDLFRLAGASWGVTLLKAGLPSAAPALFAGLRISAGLAVIGAIVSELFFLSGSGGLGQVLMNAKLDFKYEEMYAALITSSALSISVYMFFLWLGNRLFAEWHDGV